MQEEGKIETPRDVAVYMVKKLFAFKPPQPSSRVLDAGCGRGVFIRAVLEWCRTHGLKPPEIVGVEIDEELAEAARKEFSGLATVKIIVCDFLTLSEEELGTFDYIIGNPPYISYEKIEPEKRKLYKRLYKSAEGRFDVYFLFFEKALRLLKFGGRLVFITPEKYLYVLSAARLRKLLARHHVEEIELLPEETFGIKVLAYPAITVVNKTSSSSIASVTARTRLVFRNGRVEEISLPRRGEPWTPNLPLSASHSVITGSCKLADLALRISAGVATGRDEIFVVPKTQLSEELKPFALPTVSGRELVKFEADRVIDYDKLDYVILTPYDRNGRLLSEGEAKPLLDYLSRWKAELESRYAVRKERKPWYSFHEDPPLREIFKPKILWRDIARKPIFVADPLGLVVPRHTVYYLVLKNPNVMYDLLDYLNSDEVKRWLEERCQRAAKGYLRLQSHVLKRLPIPQEVWA